MLTALTSGSLNTPCLAREVQTTGDNCHIVHGEGNKTRHSVLLHFYNIVTVDFPLRLSNKKREKYIHVT